MILNGGTASTPPALYADFGAAKPGGWYEVASIPITPERVVSSSSSTATADGDANVTVNTGGVYATDFLLDVDVLPRTENAYPVITISAGGHVTLDITGVPTARSVNAGSETVTFTTNSRVTTLPITSTLRTNGANTNVLTSWRTGSAAKHIRDAMATLANATTPPASPLVPASTGSPTVQGSYVASVSLFSTLENGTGTAVRSAAHWANSINLSCVSTYGTTYGFPWAVTAITPRHAINASHVTHSIGSTLWFCTQDGNNTRVSRTITAINAAPGAADLTIYTLSSDLPGTIVPAKVLPAGWATTKIPGWKYGVPVFFVSQDPYVLILKGQNVPTSGRTSSLITNAFADTDPDAAAARFYAYWMTPRFGDSGNPTFALVNGSAVLLRCFYSPIGGDNIAEHATAINAILDDAGSYSLTVADLSGFNTYP